MSQRLRNLLEPIVTDLGYELWHLESVGAGRSSVLRLYIDSPEGIALEDCEKVSHEVSAVLDVEDSSNSQYSLEVSSPGMDRPLVTGEHFRRFIGERARINMFAPVAGQRKFRGTILAVNGDTVDLGCDDQTYSLATGDMAKARLEPVFEE
ncbi:ribosome maturation factor RimP [Salinisphaera sp.]|uniref:ribosome maturation factor RimP n=1 Tax=Salinisphaera sp. TaxID=1914330 RepID=UPI000C44D803|nr:ribosome maturation factor RimP [Salinisphaera sp.]MAS10822.1 ribosome maturation factor RimP [Salinisphaera sp.]|tara:strand:- start:1323 stop:1775 length:453 start_codon:yes stop_codon:yes gene_type:complete